jgi:hypothetical protein
MRKLTAAVLLIAAATGTAGAHFTLKAPPAYSKQDGDGLPEKSPPCGQADPGTPMVSVPGEMTFAAGDMVTITIDENIFHPGHYRVAVAQDEASLPADPTVTMDGDQCATAAIETTAVLPVVADDLFDHTKSFATPQTMQVQLPPTLTCAHCLLQVIEFMSDHPLNNPGGCFYHHCARVSITTDGVDAPPLAPDVTPVAAPSGCCDVRGGTPNLAIAAVALLVLGRRRRQVR